jgi:iron complex outermembrane receptor protein
MVCPAAACLLWLGAAQGAEEPVKTLGTVTVIGSRPTSLPTQIPTTIEGITGAQIEERINATDSEDALKYFPSLLVRKRYIGDFDHAVLASRASGTGNSARSLVYADGIPLANLLGNGATFTPRWGMVTPEEIDRVDVLYGPFSAAYSGNSVGAVVDFVTRMPRQFEAHVRAASFGQDFALFGTDERYSGEQFSASVGDRVGALSWWLGFNRLDSDGQPITFATKSRAATASSRGVAVTGAIAQRDPRNRDTLILGATNQSHTVQDHAKLKLAYEITPSLHVSYLLGVWRNEVTRESQSYLRDAEGRVVQGDLHSNVDINIDGRAYALTPADFAASRGELEHLMQGWSLKTVTRGTWDWELAGSRFDYRQDQVRTQAVMVTPAAMPNPAEFSAALTDMDGTRWDTLALKGIWRPGGLDGPHQVDFGWQREAYRLRTVAARTADDLHGSVGATISASQGNTELQSLYVQDSWSFAPRWNTTLGLRAERWRASDGATSSSVNAAKQLTSVRFGSREDTYLSPKAALAYQLTADWSLKASAGRAVRMPTVSEIYQGTPSGNTVPANDPNLRPERSWTAELTAQRDLLAGSLRTTLFHEDTRDALYSQTNFTVTPNITNVQNVDHIRTTGVEIAFQAGDVLISGLDLSTSLTYADSQIVANDNFPASIGKRQPRVPEWRANLVASYRLGERWSTTVGVRYSGEQFGTLDNSDPNGDSYMGVSDFLVVDARARLQLSRQCSVAVGVDNLTNLTYWAFHPYTQRTWNAELGFAF